MSYYNNVGIDLGDKKVELDIVEELQQHDNFEINDFLTEMVKFGVSDLHIVADKQPIYRKNGKIQTATNYPILSEEIIINSIKQILPKESLNSKFFQKLETASDFDFCYEIDEVSRFRINVCYRMYKIGMVIRVIPLEPIKLSDLHLPPALKNVAQLNNGLVLVTGPTGSGKSTSLASLLDYINENQQKHIITLEDPVEFVFENKNCVISQRQIEFDTPDFSTGVKYALRQDPDIIFIGEIRDVETLTSALKAAETGHLVFSTLHTNDAVQTINRIINLFEPSQRPFLRQQLASTLRATLAQKLVPTVDGKSRRPACELLVVTSTVQDLILKDEIESIYSLVKTGSFNQMITMNTSLYQLYKAGIISAESAVMASDNKNELQQMMRGMYHGVSRDN